MNVLFCTTLAHTPLAFGGSQQSTNDLARALVHLGCRCTVSSAIGRHYRRLGPQFFARRMWAGRPVPQVDDTLAVFRLRRPVEHLAQVVDQVHPDVAIVQAGHQHALVRELDRLGVPTVLYIRDAEFPAEAIRALPPSVVVVANSAFTAEVHRARGGSVDRVAPPLVDPGRYRVDSRRSHVVIVNPVPPKGGVVGLELARRNPDIPFLFQEGWSRHPGIWREATALPNVEWRSPTTDMRDAYRLARLVLAPSGALFGDWEEAWGRIATEAHISGIPVLATQWGGMAESVGPGGALVPRSAPLDAWNDALRSIWHDADEYDRLAAAARTYGERPEIQPPHLVGVVHESLQLAVERARITPA